MTTVIVYHYNIHIFILDKLINCRLYRELFRFYGLSFNILQFVSSIVIYCFLKSSRLPSTTYSRYFKVLWRKDYISLFAEHIAGKTQKEEWLALPSVSGYAVFSCFWGRTVPVSEAFRGNWLATLLPPVTWLKLGILGYV